MLWLAILSVAGFAFGQLPNHHQLTQLVDQGFRLSDRNHDGILQMSELEAGWQIEDANHDNQLTVEEMMKAFNLTREIAQPYFNIYDKDGDGSIPHSFLLDYVHLVDQNGDGQITLKEYEHYTVSLTECLFGHGNHGHGTNCGH
ncbi:uncharacterized protein LOC127847595 [Dreissena polymorpha]|uniref:uncharacterized protein LOC127847595 n=1 Tax=Dreissena polymorpha TaxID=45954 RepID=UPI002264DB08|nr:uncharacterized protein LOC127847595 [Dreissena polymorpha]